MLHSQTIFRRIRSEGLCVRTKDGGTREDRADCSPSAMEEVQRLSGFRFLFVSSCLHLLKIKRVVKYELNRIAGVVILVVTVAINLHLQIICQALLSSLLHRAFHCIRRSETHVVPEGHLCLALSVRNGMHEPHATALRVGEMFLPKRL